MAHRIIYTNALLVYVWIYILSLSRKLPLLRLRVLKTMLSRSGSSLVHFIIILSPDCIISSCTLPNIMLFSSSRTVNIKYPLLIFPVSVIDKRSTRAWNLEQLMMMKVGNQRGCSSQITSVPSHHSCGPKIWEWVTESVRCWRQWD